MRNVSWFLDLSVLCSVFFSQYRGGERSRFHSSFVISHHYHFLFLLVWWKKKSLEQVLLFYRNKLVTEYIKSQLSFVHVRDYSQIYNTGSNCSWTTWWNNTLFLNVLLTRLRKTPRGKWWWFTWKVEQTHSRLTVTTAVKKLTQSNNRK